MKKLVVLCLMIVALGFVAVGCDKGASKPAPAAPAAPAPAVTPAGDEAPAPAGEKTSE